MPLCQLIAMAYDVAGFRISGAPQRMLEPVRAKFYRVQIQVAGPNGSKLKEDEKYGSTTAAYIAQMDKYVDRPVVDKTGVGEGVGCSGSHRACGARRTTLSRCRSCLPRWRIGWD